MSSVAVVLRLRWEAHVFFAVWMFLMFQVRFPQGDYVLIGERSPFPRGCVSLVHRSVA